MADKRKDPRTRNKQLAEELAAELTMETADADDNRDSDNDEANIQAQLDAAVQADEELLQVEREAMAVLDHDLYSPDAEGTDDANRVVEQDAPTDSAAADQAYVPDSTADAHSSNASPVDTYPSGSPQYEDQADIGPLYDAGYDMEIGGMPANPLHPAGGIMRSTGGGPMPRDPATLSAWTDFDIRADFRRPAQDEAAAFFKLSGGPFPSLLTARQENAAPDDPAGEEEGDPEVPVDDVE